MSIEDIYYGIVNTNQKEEFLNELISNLNKYLKNIEIIIKIMELLSKANSDYLNKILDILRQNPNKLINIILLFIFDEDYRTERNFNRIVNIRSIPILNILIRKLKQYPNDFNIQKLSNMYSDIVYEYCIEWDEEDNEVVCTENFSNINYDFVNDEIIRFLFANFGNYPEFVSSYKEYLTNNPSRIIDFGLENRLYPYFQSISDNVRFYGFTYEELSYLDLLLKSKLDYPNGLDFSIESMKKILDYYNRSNDKKISERIIELIKRRLPKAYTIDFQKIDKNGTIDLSEEKEHLDYLLEEYKKSQRNDIKIIIPPEEADKFYKILSTLPDDAKIYIEYKSLDGEGEISLQEYKKAHIFYDGVAEYVSRFYLTPLEEYLFAYYLANSFKKYKYYKEDKNLDQEYHEMSRDPYFIIKHDYIVCAGYTNFLLQILKRLNISSSFLITVPEETGEYHARVLTHLVDKKYNIDGIYIGDPTNGSINWALTTKSKKSYETYKNLNKESSEYFKDAINELNLGNNMELESEEFFEFINKKIPDETIITALRNILNKIHPYLTDEQIEEKVAEIIGKSQIIYASPYYDTSKTIYESMNDAGKYSFEAFIVPEIIKNIEFKWFTGGYSAIDCQNGYLITDRHRTNDELGKILLANKHQIENEYIEIGYSSYYKHYYINIKVPSDFTVAQFKEIFLKAVEAIYISLGYKIENNIIPDNHSTELAIISSYRI